jgi:hypothetical protein
VVVTACLPACMIVRDSDEFQRMRSGVAGERGEPEARAVAASRSERTTGCGSSVLNTKGPVSHADIMQSKRCSIRHPCMIRASFRSYRGAEPAAAAAAAAAPACAACAQWQGANPLTSQVRQSLRRARRSVRIDTGRKYITVCFLLAILCSMAGWLVCCTFLAAVAAHWLVVVLPRLRPAQLYLAVRLARTASFAVCAHLRLLQSNAPRLDDR